MKTHGLRHAGEFKMMMERMNRNLAGLKENLDLLEKEVRGGQNISQIATRTEGNREISERLSEVE